MSEYNERWSKVNPLSERFLRYSRDNAGQKLKLVDVLNNDLFGKKYFDLVVELALKGYIINFIEGHSKFKVGIGLERVQMYSYFELTTSDLYKKVEATRHSNDKREKELITIIRTLEKENKQLKLYKKAGQRAFDNEEIVSTVFEDYLKRKSLSEIAENLNNSGVKSKRGGIWYKSTIKNMLQNREYIEKGYISEDTFDNVQEMLKINRINVKD